MFPRLKVPLALLVLSLLACLAVPGCKSETTRIVDAYEAAGSGGRKAAANQLRQDWAKGKITLTEAVNLAHAKLDAGDVAALAFAGGVLDTIALLDPKNRGPEVAGTDAPMENLPWPQVGSLAAKAAALAASKDDYAMANTVVLAAADLWQDEAYWSANDAHDALASTVLHKCGNSKEAVERLKSRSQLGEQSQQALDTIEREWRRARGG